MLSLLRRYGRSLTLFFIALGVSWWAVAQDRPAPQTAKARGDVADFGLIGDGIADDTAALQKAVDAGVGAIRLQKATYRITKPIVVDLDRVGFTTVVGDGVARVVMDGPGPAFKFIGTHEGTAAPSTVKENVWEKQRSPGLNGVEIVGKHPEAVGVEATGTMQFTAINLVVRRCQHAIHLTGRNRNVLLSDCHLYENRSIGVFYDNVNLHQSNINGCHISYNGGGGVVCRGGDVRNIHITGCDIEGNHDSNGEPTANVLIDSSGGVAGIGEVAIVGCTIQHNHVSPDSANIRILGKSGEKDGLPVREGNITIADNVFSDVQTNVHLRDCRGVTIVGNTFWMGFAHDLLVEESTNIVVGPNAFDRNPRYAYSDSLDADGGVVFRGVSDCTLTGLHINGVHDAPAGLLIENARRMNVTGCTVLDCDGPGIWLKDVRDSRLSDCLVRDDRDDRAEGKGAEPLRVTGGSGNQIVDNLLGDTE